MAKTIQNSKRSFQTIIEGEKFSILEGQKIAFTKKSISIDSRVFKMSQEEVDDFKFLMD
jgi:hypothetical protein